MLLQGKLGNYLVFQYNEKEWGTNRPRRQFVMEETQFTRTLDLTDESIFPAESFYAQPENPDASISEAWGVTPMRNEDIIDSVANEMKDTLG